MSLPPALPAAAYVHVPFCVHRCGYCDFTVIAGRDDLIDAYLVCLEREILTTLREPQPVKTLFIGGGTPSYLDAEQLQRLLTILQRWLPLQAGGEFSMECNPDGLTRDRMQVLRDFGINRISLGVQSFSPADLQILERAHSPEIVTQVVENLRSHGFDNVSIDLIFGVPDQSFLSWQSTLRAAVALQPQHLSTYGLTFEKGTAFWTRREQRVLLQTPEELEREMYAEGMDWLPKQGFEQYELSNFAQPGFACRHNKVYWEAEPYFGFGPGSAAYLGHVRSTNFRSVTGWLQRVERGESPVQQREELSPEDRAREAVLLGLRQIRGIETQRFQQRHGTDVRSLAPVAYDGFLETGLLAEGDGRVRLTREGRFLADTVVSEFL
ncbi:radical SAM family heme chaperone HemW [Planctomicrobium sp. SH664]|uniref:radical SAM family heme chaperone HemW n=1 Tax=Planctomicrobium sp. SH664 TaxID=3448125 RepID=UPI003F5CA865